MSYLDFKNRLTLTNNFILSAFNIFVKKNGKIFVVRIASVNIPDKKRLVIALTYIYGIGKTTAQKICEKLNISVDKKVESLNDDELKSIREQIDKNYEVESDLRRTIYTIIKNEIGLKTYRGRRHMTGLPVNGQNTHSNAKTARKKKL